MFRPKSSCTLIVLFLCAAVVSADSGLQAPGTTSSPAAATNKVWCPLWKDSTTSTQDSKPKPPPGDTVTPGPAKNSSTNSTYLFSGEHYETVVDLRVAGRGPSFIWARRYGSRIGPNTAQGNGWDYSYNIYLEQSGPDLVLHDGDGRVDTYSWNGIDTWTRAEFFRELQQNADLSYTLTFPDTGTWHFYAFDGSPAQGKISSIADRNGNEVVFLYGPAGRLNTIIDSLGRLNTISYTAEGFIESVADFAGRQVTYEYYGLEEPGGSFGDLKTATTPAVIGTPNGNDFPDGKTKTYTYTTGFTDETLNHNLLTVTDAQEQTYLENFYAHTVDMTDPRYTQDPLNINYDRLVRQVWGGPGDVVDLFYVEQVPAEENNFAVIKTIVNDRVGNVREFLFDAGNRAVMDREYTGRAPDPDAPTTDIDNRPTAPLRPGDPPYFETTRWYNNDSLVSSIHDSNGNWEDFCYDGMNPSRRSQGNLVEHWWAPGPLGGDQPYICESFGYEDGFGGCCGSNFVNYHLNGRGFQTFHDYDANGNRIHTTHAIPSSVEDWEYNAYGQMTAHIWPDNGSGHRRRDEYSYYDAGVQNGYLYQTIVDVGGFTLTTTYEYDSVGNIIRTIDARGNDTLYDVNQLDQVVREQSREVTPGSGVRYETLYYYDANDQVIQLDVQNVDDFGTVQPNAYYTIDYEYDPLNRLIRTTEEVNDRSTVVTEYEYDANGNRTLVRYGEATNGNDPFNVVQMVYDERDLLFQRIQAPGSPNQSTTQYDYDGNGNLIRTSQGLEDAPRVTEDVFDGYDRLVMSTDPMGNVTTHHYDACHNHVYQRIDGELVDVSGGAGNVRLWECDYTYDGLDRRIETSIAFFDPATQNPIGDGAATTITDYSDNSQVARVLDDNGHQTLTTYDTANRRSVVIDPKGNTVTYEYDEDSNVTTMVELELSDLGSPAEIYYTNYTYDGLDRRIRTDDNIGNSNSAGYDSRGNTLLEIDASNYENRYTYDGLDRRIETVHDMDGDGADGDGEDIVITQTWDDSSRLLSETDDQGNITAYEYDSLNRLTSTTYADGRAQSDTYDVHSNRTNTQDANGSMVDYTYDLADRATAKTIAPAPGVSPDTTFETYQYDGMSRMISAQDNDSTVARAYDSLSNVTSEILNGQTTSAVYDGVDNLLSCTCPGGREISYTYDGLDHKLSISDTGGPIATYSYFGFDRVERRDYGNGTRTDYQYDGILPNPPNDYGVKQIVATTHSLISSAAIVDARTYTWDRMYNKTQRKDVRAGGPQLTHDYSYDQIYRLRHVLVTDGGGGTVHDETYDLDGAGNRLTVTGGASPGLYTCEADLPEPADCQMNQYTTTSFDRREYDQSGNLIALRTCQRGGDCNCDGVVNTFDIDAFVLALTGGQTGWEAAYGGLGCDYFAVNDTNCDGMVNTFDIDPFVAILTGQPPALRTQITYDYRNQMVEHHDVATSLRHTYSYDPLGRRIARIVDADGVAGGPSETRYFYTDEQVIEEQDAASQTQATYVYGGYVDEVLNMQRAGVDYYYHADDLYNVMAVTDAAGGVVERYEYQDYGQAEFMDPDSAPIPQTAIGNPYLFTGRRYDDESGLYCYRSRYLEPDAGRFTSRDPVGIWGDPGNLGAAHTYVGNNPWTNLDPNGEITVKRHSFQKKRCGGFDVKWVFSLDNPAKCNGYIVQEVNYASLVAPCNGTAKLETKTYWESWNVTKGKKLEDLHNTYKWTDNAAEPSHPNTCGLVGQTGQIKFFCTKKTGDLGRQSHKPAKPNDGWGPGAEPMAGALPSTKTKPKWWDGKSDSGEKEASRFAGSLWDCCKTPELNIVVADP